MIFTTAKMRKLARRGLLFTSLLLWMVLIPHLGWSQTQKQARGSEPIAEPAIPAILAAFDKYEVVAMPEDHGLKDLDDFIFALVRNPTFPDRVNDVVVECGNPLYQPLLDRYIAGEDVPLVDVRRVWRNADQPICGGWGFGFFEQLYPLLRAINQKLPPGKRIRALAGGLPIDWEQIKGFDDILKLGPRDAGIASVMEKEVLAKRRKALMLFGDFHLFHMNDVSASGVSMYEKNYPNVTFVVSDLFAADAEVLAAFADLSSPSLVRMKGTRIGALDLSHFLPSATRIDEKDCTVHNAFPKQLQRPMEDLADAVLFLGVPDLAMKEQFPAYIALDAAYMAEVRRRESLLPGGGAATDKEFYQQFVNDAENPIYVIPKPPGPKEVQAAVQGCLDRKSHRGASKPGA